MNPQDGMTTPHGKFIWRVRAPDGAACPAAFDALVLTADPRGPDPPGPSARLIAADVPHESELPDTPVTLIVRARERAGPLVVECEALGPDGRRRLYGRASEPLAVIARSATGLLVTGLPAAPGEPLEPAT
jgi:hypothetical protein